MRPDTLSLKADEALIQSVDALRVSLGNGRNLTRTAAMRLIVAKGVQILSGKVADGVFVHSQDVKVVP